MGVLVATTDFLYQKQRKSVSNICGHITEHRNQMPKKH